MKQISKRSRMLIFVIADILISVIVATPIFLWFIFYVPQHFGFGYREYNKRPDDELSRAVREAIGKDFDYHGKVESDSGVTEYESMSFS